MKNKNASKYDYYLPLIELYVKEGFSYRRISRYLGTRLKLTSYRGLEDYIQNKFYDPDSEKPKITRKLNFKSIKLSPELKAIRDTPIEAVLEQLNLKKDKVILTPKKGKQNTYQSEVDQTGYKTYGPITVNWDDEITITNLGEYGSYIASFDKVRLIQEMYTYD